MEKSNTTNGFKETEIGMIPEDWEVVKLGEVTEKMKAGGTPRTNIKEYWENGDIPLVKVEDVINANKFLLKTNLSITGKGLKESSSWLVPENSIIFTMYGTPGEVAINQFPVAVTQNVMGVIKKEKITTEFLYYALQYARKYTLHLISDRTIFSYFTLTKAKKLLFPLPPLPEQKKIVTVLSAVQEAKEKTEEVIKTAKTLKKSLMKYLFTYGPVSPKEAGNVQLKETEIGMIPEDWEVAKFENLILDKISGEWGTGNKESPEATGCYVLRGTDFSKASVGKFDNVPFRYVKNKICEKKKLEEGEVLIELSGGSKDQPTGRIFLVSYNLIKDTSKTILFSNFVKKLKLKKTVVCPEYFYRYWQFLYNQGKTLVYEKRTTGIRNFKYNDFLENEFIPLPPLPVQQKIAEILSAVDKKIEAEENKKKSLEDLFKTLLNNLMTGKIRVNNLEV